VKSGAMSYARFSTIDREGVIRGYRGRRKIHRRRTGKTFGGAGVVGNSGNAKAVAGTFCENGYEHHVAANFSNVAPALYEAAKQYLGWKTYLHG